LVLRYMDRRGRGSPEGGESTFGRKVIRRALIGGALIVRC
jgi:hypothetical protein